MSNKNDALKQAREERSLKKRRAVEHAIAELREDDEAITFKSVSIVAGVSRQYLYNNFKEAISSERNESRHAIQTIDGVKVPKRTVEEHRHLEAVLRNKIDRLKDDLKTTRRELATTKQALEKARGESEHWRQTWVKSRSTG